MKRSILSICILLTSVSLVFANIYKKYDVRSGVSGNCVRSILQDSIGYMWFATQDGLNRFNGIEFTNYGHSSENGGNSYMNIVTICRHQDNNQIWVASTEKLYLFDSRGCGRRSEQTTGSSKRRKEKDSFQFHFCMLMLPFKRMRVYDNHPIYHMRVSKKGNTSQIGNKYQWKEKL